MWQKKDEVIRSKTSDHIRWMTGHRALRDFAFVDLGNWAALDRVNSMDGWILLGEYPASKGTS